jgi:hypothetical protein
VHVLKDARPSPTAQHIQHLCRNSRTSNNILGSTYATDPEHERETHTHTEAQRHPDRDECRKDDGHWEEIKQSVHKNGARARHDSGRAD